MRGCVLKPMTKRASGSVRVCAARGVASSLYSLMERRSTGTIPSPSRRVLTHPIGHGIVRLASRRVPTFLRNRVRKGAKTWCYPASNAIKKGEDAHQNDAGQSVVTFYDNQYDSLCVFWLDGGIPDWTMDAEPLRPLMTVTALQVAGDRCSYDAFSVVLQ